jgi:hypothetical protein
MGSERFEFLVQNDVESDGLWEVMLREVWLMASSTEVYIAQTFMTEILTIDQLAHRQAITSQPSNPDPSSRSVQRAV